MCDLPDNVLLACIADVKLIAKHQGVSEEALENDIDGYKQLKMECERRGL
jgi:hypothetical protein